MKTTLPPNSSSFHSNGSIPLVCSISVFILKLNTSFSRVSSVLIGDQAKDWTPRNSSSILGKRSVSYPKRPDHFWVPHSFLLYGYQGTFPRGYKQPYGEEDQSSRSTVEIKSEWSYTYASLFACTADTWKIPVTPSVDLHIL